MVVMYYVATVLTLFAGLGLFAYGDHRKNDGMQCVGAAVLVVFGVMLIGIWNLAAAASGCCG